MNNKYTVEGLDCPNCAKKFAALIEKIDGVESVKLNFFSEEMTVVSDVDAATLDSAVKKIGSSFEDGLTIKRK
jgi:copper chaperone CopZ